MLQVQDPCHPRGIQWGCLGLHSRDQDFAQKLNCPPPKVQYGPSKRTAIESRGLPPTHPVDKAPESQNYHNLQWKRQETSSYHFLYKTNVCLSHNLMQLLCQVGANALLCPAPFSHFSVLLGLLVLVQEGHGCLCSWKYGPTAQSQGQIQ